HTGKVALRPGIGHTATTCAKTDDRLMLGTLGAMPAADLEMIAGWVRDAGHVTVLTGAGISTDSGIPDYRGPNGVWTRNPAAERAANIQNYLADPEARRLSWRNRISSPIWRAEPNAGHLALVELERRGKLHTPVTQNVAGLPLAAGHDPARVGGSHGNAR